MKPVKAPQGVSCNQSGEKSKAENLRAQALWGEGGQGKGDWEVTGRTGLCSTLINRRGLSPEPLGKDAVLIILERQVILMAARMADGRVIRANRQMHALRTVLAADRAGQGVGK